jgi:hypothetical protein
MVAPQPAQDPDRPCVVSLTTRHGSFDCVHERATRCEVGRRLAALKHCDWCGEYDPGRGYGKRPYFVPSDTLIAADVRDRLGIESERDLFGGVVPHAFVATKVISHALVDEEASRPAGWNAGFSVAVQPAVLAGYSTFSLEDARKAGRQLLQRHGAVRLKPAGASGGQGQEVVRDLQGLEQALERLYGQDATAGLVLEESIDKPVTFSVGQVFDGSIRISYHGVQRDTLNNRGETAYGGSDLKVVRGGFDELLKQRLPERVRHAIRQAHHYHEAVRAEYPGMFASRINYDVLQGLGADGKARSGVLEQSWRLGGATAAEITALERFRERPQLRQVRTSCFEVYGSCRVPSGASIYFEGDDPQVGQITKYAMRHNHADTTERHSDPG